MRRTLPWSPFHEDGRGGMHVGARWRLFAAAWLVFLLNPLGAVVQRTNGWATVLGVALLVGFATVYVLVLPQAFRDRHPWFAPMAPWLLLGLSLAVLPLSGEAGIGCFVFVGVAFLAAYPRRVALPMLGVLVALAFWLPYRVPGWSQDGGSQAFQIVLAAAVVLAMVQLLRANRALLQAREELAELAVVEERERFARDLHDILGHSLTVITKKAELAHRLTESDPERAAAEIADVERLAREALQDVRSTVSGYREVSLSSELASARTALSAAGVRYDLPYSVDDVPREYRRLFGWVVREGVTNVLRHSGADSCRIVVTASTVEVADDGAGPPPGGPPRRCGSWAARAARARGAGRRRGGSRPRRERRFRARGTGAGAGRGHGRGSPGGGSAGAGVIRLLLADDQHLVRGALSALLSLESDLEVVAEVGRGDEVVSAALVAKPDVAVLDVEMPGMDGVAATAALRTALPSCRVLVVTTFGRPGYLRRALEAGATGFMVKDTPAEQLAEAVRRVHQGLRVVDPALAAESLAAGDNPLTSREREVLAAARRGGTAADLAAALFLSEGTVRNHLSSAIGKTGTRTRAEAARVAEERGWL